MHYRLIPGFSRYKISEDTTIIDTITSSVKSTVVHKGTVSVNLVNDSGVPKRIKLVNAFNLAFPEKLPGVLVLNTDGYRVTEEGCIYSTIQGRYIKGAISKSGYELLTLRDVNGVPFNQYTHILVAKAFVEGYFVGATVNHKDGNKRNNNKSNLEWITSEENVKHAWETGLCDTKHKKCAISKDGVSWIEFAKLVDAKEYLESIGAKLPNVSHLTRAAKQNEGLDTPKYLCRGFYVKYK